MKRVSQQGKTLSPSQKRHLAFQAQIKFMTVSPLRAEVDETLRQMAELKEQGVRPEPLNKVIERKKGTPSIAEWMGF
jgi:hypothetical protein